MTVGATDFALRDLLQHGSPRMLSTEHRRDVVHLVAEMVEVKDRQVGFPAVHAGMRKQVVPDPLFNLAVMLLPVALDSWHLNDAVRRPPLTVVRASARTADVVARAGLT